MPEKHLIVGLGNPGRRYHKNRHNLGFMAVDALARQFDCSFKKSKCFAQVAQTAIAGKAVIIAKPQAYMNRSGESVACLAAYYHIDVEHILIIVDDADLPLGSMRLRKQGSAGGHNGLKSIIACLHTQAFPRLRLGMGRPVQNRDMVEYVLSNLSKTELAEVKILLSRANDAVVSILQRGIEATMNEFNAPEPLPE
ncbi:aminoacyl-tRNA hydrolase [candidate division KSB1 bacterium]|nr:aminoacyl-tRNA hydrolase [candidate division KSB1 bacterium]